MARQRLTDWGRNFLLDVLFGKTETMPDTLYLAALIVMPTPSDTGATISEPADTNYARIAIDNSSGGTFWKVAAGGSKDSNEGVTWAAADSDWASSPGYGICDAASGGNLLLYGEWPTSFLNQAGHTVYFNPGSISIVLISLIQRESV